MIQITLVMLEPSSETDTFIAELDAAVEAHMNWTRRIVRCAVLHTARDDVLDPLSHTLCRFGAGSWRTGSSSRRSTRRHTAY